MSNIRVLVLSAMSVFVATAVASFVHAEDWPEIQGKGRQSVWKEDGILDKFPAGGLTVRWRTPIRAGYTGPAVADGRVFVADYQALKDEPAVERVLCLDEQTGKVLWTYENSGVEYGKVGYGYGPRATPTVDGERVFVLGTAGDLLCLDTKTGRLNWKVNYRKDLNARIPTWGFASAPIVYGDRLICLVGAAPDAAVVALDKKTGKELWHAARCRPGPGYSAPIITKAAGVDQLIQWHGGAVSSLNPETGEVYWQQAFEGDLLVATPVREGNLLFFSAFYGGPMMLDLAEDKPDAKLLWRGTSRSEVKTDGLHSITSTPVIKDGHVYGICSYGQLRCLDARTGERIWESLEVTKEKERWASAFFTRHGDRFFINNDRGELIIAELSPAGYKEIDRTELIKPTSPSGNRRERGAVNWCLPAYANRHIIIRNDREIIRVSLEKPPAATPNN